LVAASVVAAALFVGVSTLAAAAANQQPQRDVLILGPTVSIDPATGLSPEEFAARSLGLSVEIADNTAWSTKTAAEFSAYKAIVRGRSHLLHLRRHPPFLPRLTPAPSGGLPSPATSSLSAPTTIRQHLRRQGVNAPLSLVSHASLAVSRPSDRTSAGLATYSSVRSYPTLAFKAVRAPPSRHRLPMIFGVGTDSCITDRLLETEDE
jgi:hypothetical protein